MPTYDYRCAACGGFSAIRPLAERNALCACPSCGTASAREIFAMPMLAGLSAQSRQAHAINERSAAEPRSLADYRASRHGGGCSCCVPGKGSKNTLRLADGSRPFTGRRPWQISH
ncbi:MAG: zinc ribbon domain-containing protein [Burkholderiales bacterium]|nr:zinc ribbon domain-containing protein [Burkholderiales bacterium]